MDLIYIKLSMIICVAGISLARRSVDEVINFQANIEV